MTTPKDRIAAGLDAREREKSGTTTPYNHLSEVPQTTAEVNRLAVRAKTLRDRLKAITTGVHAHMDGYRKDAEARFANIGKQTTETGSTIDTLGDNRRRRAIEDDISAHRRDVLTISEGDRAGILTELRTINQKLRAVADMHNDPVAILMTSTLGSKRRGEFARDLEHSGPREIELAVKRALVQGDRDLLAACFSRMDSCDKRTRELINVSKADAAQHTVADQLQLGLQSLALADVSLAESEMLDNEVNGKKASAGQKIKLGTMKRDLKNLGIDLSPEAEDPDDNAPGNKSTLAADEWEKQLNAKYPAVPVPDNVTVIGGGNV